MTCPAPEEFNLVVAAADYDEEGDFLDTDSGPATIEIPGAVNGAWYWKVADGHSLSNFGDAADTADIAGPNGSTFGVMCFPGHSAGKLDVSATNENIKEFGGATHDDSAMHSKDSIDYEIVLSGKVRHRTPGGKVRTLQLGDLLGMGGVPHAAKNR